LLGKASSLTLWLFLGSTSTLAFYVIYLEV